MSDYSRATEAWDAAHPVDEERARALIAQQFSRIDTTRLEAIGSGWDNDMWRAGAWAFRFPRRAFGVEAIDTEIRVLPALALRLPLAIPRPTWIGAATPEYPSAFYGHSYLDGETVEKHSMTLEQRAECVEPLAIFLRELHGLDREEGLRLGIPDRLAASQMERLKNRALEEVARLRFRGLGPELDEAERRLEACPADSSPGSWTVIHADFHARHIVLDASLRPSGVLDWGDICFGDPAVDLSIAYTFLPADLRERFFSVYGEVDPETKRRARHVGLTRYGLITLDYAMAVGNTLLEQETRWSLQCCLDE